MSSSRSSPALRIFSLAAGTSWIVQAYVPTSTSTCNLDDCVSHGLQGLILVQQVATVARAPIEHGHPAFQHASLESIGAASGATQEFERHEARSSLLATSSAAMAGAPGAPLMILGFVIVLLVVVALSTGATGAQPLAPVQRIPAQWAKLPPVEPARSGSSTSGSTGSRSIKRVSFQEPPGHIMNQDPAAVQGQPALPPTAGSQGGMCWIPAICHSLILPNSHTIFRIDLDDLLTVTTGDLDIMGTKGARVLLKAFVGQAGDGRRGLTLGSARDDFVPCIRVAMPAVGANANALEIYGRGAEIFGRLETDTISRSRLVCKGCTAMIVEHDDPASLKMSVSLPTPSGQIVAMAKRELFEGSDYLVIFVQPGIDAVLITSMMLAVVLMVPFMGGHNASYSSSMTADTASIDSAGSTH